MTSLEPPSQGSVEPEHKPTSDSQALAPFNVPH